MIRNKTKNYDGHIYVQKNLQQILNTSELNSANSSISVLLFPDDVSLKRARDSLKTIKAVLDDMISKEEEENNNEDNL